MLLTISSSILNISASAQARHKERAPLSAPYHPSFHQSLIRSKTCPRTQFGSPQLWRGNRIHGRQSQGLRVRALDAAMPFDYEHIKKKELEKGARLKIGVVGFGTFGQFLARRLVQHNHLVSAFSRSDYTKIAQEMGVKYFRDMDDFCEDHPDVVIIATSILSTETVLRCMPLYRLKRNTLMVDVLSVKVFPKKFFLQYLPQQFDILCTHPMFGPDSGKGSWEGLAFVYEQVRVGRSKRDQDRIAKFLKIFKDEGCRMVEMSCEEHDRWAASSQFITHTVGRILGRLGLESTPINTKGYETLLTLVDNTCKDSFDLYYGLFMFNLNSTNELLRFENAFDEVRSQLYDRLHRVLREELFGLTPPAERRAPQSLLPGPGQSSAQDASPPSMPVVSLLRPPESARTANMVSQNGPMGEAGTSVGQGGGHGKTRGTVDLQSGHHAGTNGVLASAGGEAGASKVGGGVTARVGGSVTPEDGGVVASKGSDTAGSGVP